MNRLFFGAALAVLIAPAAHAQSVSPEVEAAQLRGALARLQADYQTTTGAPLLGPVPSPAGLPSQEQITAQIKALQALQASLPSAAGPPVQGVPQAAAEATAGQDFEKYTGPTAKIPIGYVGSGVLDMTAMSDYPGPWRGHLSQPIYSIDGRNVLFPEGTTVVGRTVRITGANEAINNRMGFIPQYLVRTSDGQAFPIKNQAVLDQLGISGLTDEVDYHLVEMGAAIGAFTAVEALPNILEAKAGAQPQQNNFTGSLLGNTSTAGDNLLSRYTALVPTITVRARIPFRIFFTAEMLGPVTHPRDRLELTNIGPGGQ